MSVRRDDDGGSDTAATAQRGACVVVGTDVLVGVTLTLLAWGGLLVTVVRGRANVERHASGRTARTTDDKRRES